MRGDVMNRTTEGIIWVALVICLVVAVFLFVRGSMSQAAVFGCVTIVLAIVGGSVRHRDSGSRGPRAPGS
jgi:hypothetical protein